MQTPPFHEAFAHAFLTPDGDRIVFSELFAHIKEEDVAGCPSNAIISAALGLTPDGSYKILETDEGHPLIAGIQQYDSSIGPWLVVGGAFFDQVIADMKAKGISIPDMNDPVQQEAAVRRYYEEKAMEERAAEEDHYPVAAEQIPPQDGKAS